MISNHKNNINIIIVSDCKRLLRDSLWVCVLGERGCLARPTMTGPTRSFEIMRVSGRLHGASSVSTYVYTRVRVTAVYTGEAGASNAPLGETRPQVATPRGSNYWTHWRG